MNMTEAMREQFEAWAKDRGMDVAQYATCDYINDETSDAWTVWQDALRSPAVAGLVDQALDAAAFLNGIGRNDRAQPLRKAAHEIRTPEEDLAQYATLAGEKA